MANCRGNCFESYGPTDKNGDQLLWRKCKKCPCKLQKCERCGDKVPQRLLDMFSGKWCSHACVFNWEKQINKKIALKEEFKEIHAKNEHFDKMFKEWIKKRELIST